MLQHFVEGVEAVAAYLGMMGTELNPRKCPMATTERVTGRHLRLCPRLEIPWHWVPAADSVPYLGLQLQTDGEFSLQHKHRLRLAAVHHWCLNTLAPPKVVQDVILVILRGVTEYIVPFIADNSDTTQHLDHITVKIGKKRARYAFDASPDSLQGNRNLGLRGVPTWCRQTFWKITDAHGICPEVHYPVPEFASLAESDCIHRIPWSLAVLGSGSTTPSSAPGRPTSSCSPPGAMSSRCVPQYCDTVTHAV